jgi:RNA polymerase sigma factor (sigma-70 family)
LTFIKDISPDPASDLELVTAYRQSSDLGILATLYQRYMDLLYAVCLKYLKDPETSKDAVMNIFEELSRKLLRHEVDNFRGWIYTLAKNHCLMQLRSSGRLKTQSLSPANMQSEEEWHLKEVMEKEESLDRLSKCMDTLSADQKAVIGLFYLENKCYKEIETVTGLNWNKVRSLIQNGRRNLKICLERQADDAQPAAILNVIEKK